MTSRAIVDAAIKGIKREAGGLAENLASQILATCNNDQAICLVRLLALVQKQDKQGQVKKATDARLARLEKHRLLADTYYSSFRDHWKSRRQAAIAVTLRINNLSDIDPLPLDSEYGEYSRTLLKWLEKFDKRDNFRWPRSNR